MNEIDISDHIENFKEHLNIEENIRIVVSGAFGSGKTYFLNKFFVDNIKDYNVIKLFPVNYSVAKNEDIFDLIKFDILFELICNENITFNEEYFDKSLTSQVFFQQNAFDILEPLIEKIPKIGKAATKAVTGLMKFGENFEKFHKSVQVDEKEKVIGHLKKIKDAIASVEEDSITEIIRTSIQSLSRNDKKSVLLIDDLDRIDPEHIFRILNIFSSHFEEKENKFFFDKIILVCDIENIRAIFHTRYGSKIDFSGYIDKFYSRNIFRFNNNAQVEFYIDESVRSINFNGVTSMAKGEINGYSYRLLIALLKELLSRHYINLRKIVNLKNIVFKRNDEIYVVSQRNISISRRRYPVIVVIELLIEILGSKKNLIEAITDFRDLKISLRPTSNTHLGLIIPILDITQNQGQQNKEFTYNDDENSDFNCTYTLRDYSDVEFANITPNVMSPDKKNHSIFKQPNDFRYFLKLIELLNSMGII